MGMGMKSCCFAQIRDANVESGSMHSKNAEESLQTLLGQIILTPAKVCRVTRACVRPSWCPPPRHVCKGQEVDIHASFSFVSF